MSVRMIKMNKKGFTLMETLAAVLVLMLICVGITTGLASATREYRRSLFVTDSQVLENTIRAAATDVLRYATFVKNENNSAYFSNAEMNILPEGQIVNGSEEVTGTNEGYLYIKRSDSSYTLLVNKGAYGSLTATGFTLSYEAGAFTGTYTIVLDEDLTKNCTFTVRSLSEAD